MSRPEPEAPGLKYIYALIDPRTLLVRYVGQSTEPLKRLSHHLAPRSLRVENAKNRWLKTLLALSLRPLVIILQTVAPDRWADAERAWIVQGRMIGWELVNTSDGGEGVLAPTPETAVAQREERASQARARHGRRRSPAALVPKGGSPPKGGSLPAPAAAPKPAAVPKPATRRPRAAKEGRGDSASLAPGPPPQHPSRTPELLPLPPNITRRKVERRKRK